MTQTEINNKLACALYAQTYNEHDVVFIMSRIRKDLETNNDKENPLIFY